MATISRYFKNRLQEYCQEKRLPNPSYDGFEPSSRPAERWGATVSLEYKPNEAIFIKGDQGFPTKGDAEQYVAFLVLRQLGVDFPSNVPLPATNFSTSSPSTSTPSSSSTSSSSTSNVSKTATTTATATATAGPTRSRTKKTELAKELDRNGNPPPKFEFVCRVILPTGQSFKSKSFSDPSDAENDCAREALTFLRRSEVEVVVGEEESDEETDDDDEDEDESEDERHKGKKSSKKAFR